jgi:hypothetical protein
VLSALSVTARVGTVAAGGVPPTLLPKDLEKNVRGMLSSSQA